MYLFVSLPQLLYNIFIIICTSYIITSSSDTYMYISVYIYMYTSDTYMYTSVYIYVIIIINIYNYK